MYNPDNYLAQVAGTLFVWYQIALLYMDSAVFIFPKLLADFKVQIQE